MNKVVTIISFFFFCSASFAGVNFKNGNFYISYTDHNFSSNNGVEITRTYNSKASGAGLFGNGWGCYYETFLMVIGDGTLVVAEHGAGAKTVFETGTLEEDLLVNCLNQLSAAAIKNNDINNNPSAVAAYKEKLRNNQEQRHTAWFKYLQLNLIQPYNNVINTIWQSADMGFQTIVKIDENNYKRVSSDGFELFNNKGQLLAEYDKYNKLKFRISYNKTGKIETLEDAVGNELKFTLNANNLITAIKSSKGTSIYKYDGKDLIETLDVNGNVYKHTYDDRYNMTSIIYSDNTKMLIEYYSTTYYTKKVTDRNNKSTSYVYVQFFDDNGAVNDDHYATYVIKQNESEQLDSNYYEYEIKAQASGVRYTYRIATIINQVKTETIYDENGSPLSIVRGNNSTTFKYNSKGGLLYKETKNEIFNTTYNETETKILRYEVINKYYKDTTVYTYTYNEKDDLVYGTEDTLWVKLHYSPEHRISKMEFNNGIIYFEYNAIGKPNMMKMEGDTQGMINIAYDENGEIKKVESKDGNSMSIKITTAFQQLLKITKPSGMSLGL